MHNLQLIINRYQYRYYNFLVDLFNMRRLQLNKDVSPVELI